MCQQRNLKVLALMMTIFIIASSSIQPKKAEAVVLVDDVAMLAVVGLGLAGMATLGIISAQQTISPSDVSALKDKISAGGETLISGVNNLGNAIKTGADKATVQALASGAVVYGMLQAMQEVMFPNEVVKNGNIATSGLHYVCTSGDYSYYLASGAMNDDSFNNFTIKGSALYFSRSQLKYGYAPGQVAAQLAVYCYENGITDYYKYYKSFSDNLFFSDPDNMYVYEGYGTRAITDAIKVGSYTEKASTIASASSISVPSYLPQTIINNITSYDGTSDLVLGLPDGTTYTGDDLLTVDPTTVPEDPTTPDPTVPSYPDVLSATIAILSALTPISALLDNINLGVGSLSDVIDLGNTAIKDGVGDIVDAITGTTAGVLTNIGSNIGSMVEPVTTSIENFFSPPSKDIDWDKLKNIQIFDKFPFSIPADLYFLMTMLASDPVAPKVDFNVDLSFIGASNSAYSYDLSQFDNFAQILRNFELLAFVLFMLYTTKNLIWK